MDIKKKDKTKILAIIIFLIFSSSYILFFQRVSVIYFTNPNCRLTKNTDILISYLEKKFENRIIVKTVKIQMYPGDKEDTQEIKTLKEKYKVYGVPHIVINGKEFTSEFTKDNLEKEICKQFIIKPDECR